MLFINADDYGLSRGINNGILECAKYGIVNGISIVPNGYAFKDGIKKIPSKKIKKISIHVNLVELEPVSPTTKIGNIINENKELNLSPLKLIAINFFYTRNKKKLISDQIQIEIENQIKKVIKKINKKKYIIGIDSHYHIHVLPFVFKIIIKLAKKYKIKYLRIPIESNIFYQFSFKYFFEFFVNLPKVILINFFSLYCKYRYLKKSSIDHNQKFYGSLFSGNFSSDKFEKALVLAKRYDNGVTEIISHPGDIIASEKKVSKNKYLIDNYFSKNRIIEKNALSNKKPKKI